jgi:hypothetical protein
MSENIEFDTVFQYDTLKKGITVKVKLFFNEDFVEFNAKIDTGAENCIFQRIQGERLGLDIENGNKETFSTVTGSFVAYGHELSLSVLGIETNSTVYFAESEFFTRNVLGGQGWLDRVKLGLIDSEGRLFLSESN